MHHLNMGFPGSLVVKNLPASTRNMGSIPGLGRSPGEGNGKLTPYPCLGNLMFREAAAEWTAVPGVPKESDTS